MSLNSHFRPERVPSPESFYSDELGKLSRASRRWCRTACPFHKGKNKTAFSVNLDSGGFTCFNCGVHGGSIVDYIMLRDSCTFKQAAQSLGAWDDAASFTWAQTRQFKKDRERRRAAEAERAEGERQGRIEARDELHLLERCYDFATHRLSQIQQLTQSSSNDYDVEHCWQIMAIALPMIREADATYRRLAGIEVYE